MSHWEHAEKILSKNKLNVVLIMHVQEPRGQINWNQIQCASTERFSVDEFNEIYQGIVAAGYYISATYYNELDFVSDYLAHPDRFHDCLIYTLARNGRGFNKKVIIPAFCDLMNLSYSSSSALSCALCRNKYYFSTLLRSQKLPTPKSWLLDSNGTWVAGAPPVGTLVICKPAAESASQGVNETGIFISSTSAYEKYRGAQYIVQEFIDGDECEVPIIKCGDEVISFPPVGINLMGKRILDEASSENYEYTFYALSTRKDSSILRKVRHYAESTFRLMEMDTYGRVDFRIDESGIPYIFDISTTPYTTRHSSYAFAFEQAGLEYSDIYRTIISAALLRE